MYIEYSFNDVIVKSIDNLVSLPIKAVDAININIDLMNKWISALVFRQMCSKDTREAPGTSDHVPTTVVAPARFDNRPSFRQKFTNPESVK